MWTVWLGWHTVERISTVPNGWLRWVRNPSKSARAKASLIGFSPERNPKTKVWSSERQNLIDGGLARPKSYSGDNRVVAPESSLLYLLAEKR